MTAEGDPMNTTDDATVEGVKSVLVDALGLQDRAGTLDASTPLFGSLPELDSLGVVQVAAGLEERFDIVLEGEDMTGEAFETIGSLGALVDSRRAAQS
jgi:acyl carrier protein